ncbi:MAG: fluoride efflux transporter CrcB [Bacteroidaceae bacterium]|nr:fluoride efflux transporter CrcB [Bacteroidaceae bacterium]
MFREILLVGAGSFFGGSARYLVSYILRSAAGFPWGTFVVNVLGCLLIGLLWGWSSRSLHATSSLMLFLSVGFCGGFTTFSTFSKEGLALLQSGSYGLYAIYVLASVALGLLAVLVGFSVTK